MDEQLASVSRVQGKPFWSQSPQLVERLSSLNGTVSSQFRAPSPAQQSYIDEITDEYNSAIESLDAFLQDEVSAFNELLNTNQIPNVIVNLGSED